MQLLYIRISFSLEKPKHFNVPILQMKKVRFYPEKVIQQESKSRDCEEHKIPTHLSTYWITLPLYRWSFVHLLQTPLISDRKEAKLPSASLP